MTVSIPISLPEGRSYSVVIESGGLSNAARHVDPLGIGTDAFVVTDSMVGPLYRDRLIAALLEGKTRDAASREFRAGEPSKTVETWNRLMDSLLDYNASGKRKLYVVALGGGVVGDVAGFLAATFRRGIPVVQVATSVIAMVDSAIGGKTGVDHPRAKNMVGAFYQPRLVLIDPSLLVTLERRELLNGMAEVIKYGVIRDPELFESLYRDREKILGGSQQMLAGVIERCVRIKADYVEKDEFDRTGIRAELNFGHTIGHAIETATAYQGLYLHGEAVAVGMLAACDVAERLGMLGPELRERLTGLLQTYGLPTQIRGCGESEILESLKLDKKNISGRHRMVLPRRVGQVEVVDGVDEAAIRDSLRGYLA